VTDRVTAGALHLPLPVPAPAAPYVPDRSRENRLAPRSRRVEDALAALTPPVDGPGEPEKAERTESPAADRPAAPAARAPAPKPAEKRAQAPPPPEAAAPVEEPEEIRELVARRGDPISIDLQGGGWIYTGLRGGAASGEGIEFLTSRNAGDRTSFSFKAAEHGVYDLGFQYQDNRQATLRTQVIRIRVVPEEDFAAALQRQQSGATVPQSAETRSQPEPGPPIPSADALFAMGEYELALIEYKRNMRGGDPYLIDRLAECYERTGEYMAAVKYFRENLGLQGEYGARAATGLARAGVAMGDSLLLMEVMPALFGVESEPIGEELLEIARFQMEDHRYTAAIQALEQYIRRYPDGKSLDEVYYRLAGIYEVDSPYRDIESARHYYSLIYELYPESRYSDPAGERIDYLDRHFFLVQ
jgi:tetratricopeptide (TPR) repeat protein